MHPAIALHGHTVYTGQDYRLYFVVWKCTILLGVNEAQFTHEYAGMYNYFDMDRAAAHYDIATYMIPFERTMITIVPMKT